MTVTLIGCGCGSLTGEARAAIESAELLIGSERLLKEYGGEKAQIEAVTVSAITDALKNTDAE